MAADGTRLEQMEQMALLRSAQAHVLAPKVARGRRLGFAYGLYGGVIGPADLLAFDERAGVDA